MMKQYIIIPILIFAVSIGTITIIITSKTLYNYNGNINTFKIHNESIVQRKARQIPGYIETPIDRGFMNIYIHETCHVDRRLVFNVIRFPYVRYDRRRFVISRFWIRYSRRMPIFVHRFTRQTVIFSTVAAYIFPAIVNYHRRVFSLAQLLAYGYATFLRNGVRLPTYANLGFYAQPSLFFPRGTPLFNLRTRSFATAIRSNYRSYFLPECDTPDDVKDYDKHLPIYDDHLNKYPQSIKEYYNKNEQYSRPYYPGPQKYSNNTTTTNTEQAQNPSAIAIQSEPQLQTNNGAVPRRLIPSSVIIDNNTPSPIANNAAGASIDSAIDANNDASLSLAVDDEASLSADDVIDTTGSNMFTTTDIPSVVGVRTAIGIGRKLRSQIEITIETSGKGWINIGTMNNARRDHTVSLLANGKVLVTGGLNDKNIVLHNAESYDPETRIWTNIDSMTDARYYHTASLFSDGTVFVTGGLNDDHIALNTSELYNSDGTWSITGSMNYARYAHTESLFSNGLVLVTGGADNDGIAINSTELYNSTTETWTITGSMNNPRYFHTISLLNNEQILVTGGISNNNALDTVELYDPIIKTWTITSNMNYARYGHTASLLSSGMVLVTGGADNNGFVLNTAELYDSTKGTWTITGSMNNPRSGHTTTLLANGKVLVTGGIADNMVLDSAELYDPITGIWTITTNAMKNPRRNHRVTRLTNGMILVTGGINNNNTVINSTELYQL